MRFAFLSAAILFFAVAAPVVEAQAPPTFHVSRPPKSTISFEVDASVALKGIFNKWESNFTCPSTDALACTLEINIEADSVDTGSGMKNGKLKGGDFFDVKENPYITFKSTKIVMKDPKTFEIDGDFTIRGVTKQEQLTMIVEGAGTRVATVNGTMAFDREDYGMDKGIPFIKIANRVQVTCDLHATRTSGPPLVFSKQ